MHKLKLFLIPVWIASCAPATQFVVPEYIGKKLKAEKLILCVNRDRIIINNPDDVADDLGSGSDVEVFYGFFDTTVARVVPIFSNFKSAELKPYPEKDRMQTSTFALGSKAGQINVHLPPQDKPLDLGGVTPTFILFIDLMQIRRDAGSPGMMFMGPKGSSTMSGGRAASLIANVNYVLWDNRAGKVMAYGKTEVSTAFFLAMTRGTWKSNAEDIIRSILQKSPFQKEITATGY